MLSIDPRNLVLAWVYDLAATQVLDVASVRLRRWVMAVLLLDWVLWGSWYVVVGCVLIWTDTVMRVSVRWRVRLNGAGWLLTELLLEPTVVGVRREIVLIMLSTTKLLTSFIGELTLMEVVTRDHLGGVGLLGCLVIHGDSRRSILPRGPSLGRAWCIFVRVAISAVSFHELLTIPILRDRLQLTNLHLSLMYPMWIWAIQILRLRRWVAAYISHMGILMRCILILLMEIRSRLEFNPALDLIYIFLRILPDLFRNRPWRLIACI